MWIKASHCATATQLSSLQMLQYPDDGRRDTLYIILQDISTPLPSIPVLQENLALRLYLHQPSSRALPLPAGGRCRSRPKWLLATRFGRRVIALWSTPQDLLHLARLICSHVGLAMDLLRA